MLIILIFTYAATVTNAAPVLLTLSVSSLPARCAQTEAKEQRRERFSVDRLAKYNSTINECFILCTERFFDV